MPYTRLNYEHPNYTKFPALQKEESVVWDGSSVLTKENDLESMLLKVRHKDTTEDELVEILTSILVEGFLSMG